MLNSIYRHAASLTRAPLFFLVASCLLTAPVAQAAEVMPMEAVDPVPFSQYQTWRDEPVQDWREANDRVGEIGGWMTYLREVQQDDGDAQPGMHHHHGH